MGFQERVLAPRVLHFHMEEMFGNARLAPCANVAILAGSENTMNTLKWSMALRGAESAVEEQNCTCCRRNSIYRGCLQIMAVCHRRIFYARYYEGIRSISSTLGPGEVSVTKASVFLPRRIVGRTSRLEEPSYLRSTSSSSSDSPQLQFRREK